MKRQRNAPETKRDAILDAALKLFSQYGYRRTSIDDIAREAEIAKGTVYLSFESKEEIFCALCEFLIERSENGVKAACATTGPINERLAAALEAKFGFLFETVYRSPHAAELMDSKNRLSADLFARSGRRYMKVLREMIEQATRAGELDLSSMQIDADEVAQMLVAAAHGIESAATSPAQYHRRLREIVRVIVAGLTPARVSAEA
ncbi:MAG TPA: TetR/AcrR family transcriptional regulator [Candidatus Binatus sp.]|nr:TetR/AcrR family transcriptional regulator [Candidatus Binatus sp.]